MTHNTHTNTHRLFNLYTKILSCKCRPEWRSQPRSSFRWVRCTTTLTRWSYVLTTKRSRFPYGHFRLERSSTSMVRRGPTWVQFTFPSRYLFPFTLNSLLLVLRRARLRHVVGQQQDHLERAANAQRRSTRCRVLNRIQGRLAAHLWAYHWRHSALF